MGLLSYLRGTDIQEGTNGGRAAPYRLPRTSSRC